MKKILVPVDFSEHSEYALKTAATIAKKNDSEIVVLHMLGLSESVLTKNESKETNEAIFYMKLAEKQFNDFLDKEYLENIKIETAIQNYTHFKEVITVAEDYKADLIVMGSHGSSGIKEVFVGSNTEKVVRTSSIPVLVVKNNITNFEMKKVVIACDFNLDFIVPFKKAWELFNTINADIQILYVNLPDKFISTQEMKTKAFKFFVHAGINEIEANDKVIYYNDYVLEDGIFTFSNEFDADLIAIPTHGRKGLSHFFSENVGEALVNHSDIPMMTFKV